MCDSILGFYDPLAAYYHLIFEDWDQSIERQATVLNQLLATHIPLHPLKILDCACGIGTQTLGFAKYGHRVVASDLSPAAVNRAKNEAKSRGFDPVFYVSDMTNLSEIPEIGFDVVAALDNALPHLAGDQLVEAVRAMGSKLRPGGLLLASIRDYDELILQRPTMQGPTFYGAQGSRRIVFQIWDWMKPTMYKVHQYISVEGAEGWETHHFVSEYHCILRDELSRALRLGGFEEVRWLMPGDSGFYQPIVLARKVA